KLIEKTNLRYASAIHVTSTIEHDELKYFGWKLPQVVTIPNGVDEMKHFAASEVSADVKEITTGQPRIPSFGRISWIKGLDRLLKAFARTKAGKLVIVGPDDEGLTPKLVQLARQMQIAGRVQFIHRMVLGADKEHLFKSAKVVVLPSYSENFGI